MDLHYMMDSGYAEKRIIAAIKDGADVNVMGRYGYTVLIKAIKTGQSDTVIRELIRAGCDVNACLAHEESIDPCEWWKLEDEYNSKWRDTYVYAPLFVALERERLNCVRMLLDAGARINVVACWGETLLHRVKEVSVYKELISRGMNPNVLDDFGSTPLLHICLRENYGNFDLYVEMLRSGGYFFSKKYKPYDEAGTFSKRLTERLKSSKVRKLRALMKKHIPSDPEAAAYTKILLHPKLSRWRGFLHRLTGKKSSPFIYRSMWR